MKSALLAFTLLTAFLCIGAAQADVLDKSAGRFALRAGVSDAVDYSAFSQAYAQALTALRRGGAGVTRYADATAGGVLGDVFSTKYVSTENSVLRRLPGASPVNVLPPVLSRRRRTSRRCAMRKTTADIRFDASTLGAVP